MVNIQSAPVLLVLYQFQQATPLGPSSASFKAKRDAAVVDGVHLPNMPRSLRSPSVTLCDFFTWGFVKSRVYGTQLTTIKELAPSQKQQSKCDTKRSTSASMFVYVIQRLLEVLRKILLNYFVIFVKLSIILLKNLTKERLHAFRSLQLCKLST